MIHGGKTHREMSELSPRYGPDAKNHQKVVGSCSLGVSARSSLIPVLQRLSPVLPEDIWFCRESSVDIFVVTTKGGGDVL